MKSSIRLFIIFIISLFVGTQFLHAEQLMYNLKTSQGKLIFVMDYPSGWIEKKNPIWPCLFENEANSNKMMGFHAYYDQRFDIENVSDVLRLFDTLSQSLYVSRRAFTFFPPKGKKFAVCCFLGKPLEGEEVEVRFVIYHAPNSGLVYTWMDSEKDAIDSLEKNSMELLNPTFYTR